MAFERDNDEQPVGAPQQAPWDDDHGAPAWPMEAGMGSPADSTSAEPGDPQAAGHDDSDAPIAMDAGSQGGQPWTGGGDVRAEHVTLNQGGASTIDATTVSITQGGAGRVRAEQLNVSMGGVGMARTRSLTVDEGGSAFAVMADEATVDDGANVFMLVARSVSGDVRPALDWRAALAFGAGFAAVVALLRRRR